MCSCPCSCSSSPCPLPRGFRRTPCRILPWGRGRQKGGNVELLEFIQRLNDQASRLLLLASRIPTSPAELTAQRRLVSAELRALRRRIELLEAAMNPEESAEQSSTHEEHGVCPRCQSGASVLFPRFRTPAGWFGKICGFCMVELEHQGVWKAGKGDCSEEGQAYFQEHWGGGHLER